VGAERGRQRAPAGLVPERPVPRRRTGRAPRQGAQTWAKIPKDKLVPGGPTHELRDNGGDSREYCHWVWHEDDRPNTLNMRRPSWTTDQLLEMPIDFRRWDPESVPGTYPVEPALVELIRERYL
jgi:hypothetical protein